jgi:voltage-gated potassium channel
MEEDPHDEKSRLADERHEVLEQLENWLEAPMLVLGFAWLVLFIVEVIWGLSPFLETVGTIIWIIFIIDFAVRFSLAPDKLAFLKTNWLTAISLLAPALRLLRIARVIRLLRLARVARGLRLLRIISSLNRGMRALGASMGRRGFGYVVALTLIVTLVGAAGMLAFEGEVANGTGLRSYGDALWWTAMMMTTSGSDYWPRTPEGRALALLLALYAFAVFGYVTATLATFFVGREAESQQGELAGNASVAELRADIAALREEIRALKQTEARS